MGESRRHGGGCDDCFEGAFPLLHVELRVEDDDVDFGHVEHPEGHGCTQVHGDGQRGSLDVQLGGQEKKNYLTDSAVCLVMSSSGDVACKNRKPNS